MILNKYDCTKDKVQLYFDHYLDSILISLGFKLSNSGTKYIKEIIKLLYFESIDLNLSKIYLRLSKTHQIKSSRICSEIKYSINVVDYSCLKLNFKRIFGFDFVPSYVTSKELIYLIYNKVLRDEIESKNKK